MTHALKTWPEYFMAIERGDKNFDIRKFDRPFKVGDRLLLQSYDPNQGINRLTGHEFKIEECQYFLKVLNTVEP